VWTIDPFVGTWRDASPSSASEDFTLFIAKTGSGYKATLYKAPLYNAESEGGGGYSIRVPLLRTGDKLTGGGFGRSTLTIVRRKGGRIGVDGYGAPEEMVRASTATNPVFE
jgi:hypothetical protein